MEYLFYDTILRHTYVLESKSTAKYIWQITSYIFHDPYSKPYVSPRMDMQLIFEMEKLKNH